MKVMKDFNGMTLGNGKQARIARKMIRDLYAQAPAREKAPLSDESRTHADPDDWESCTEYGFLPDRYNGLSDEDLRDLEAELWEYTGCAWDCSGKLFTVRLDLHRNPSGRISFIHVRAIDC